MYRVVIVDDEEPVLNSYEFIFNKYVTDFKICGMARSGLEAVSLVKELIPDVVFMDIEMPGINGLEAITQLQPWVPKTLFILSTAYERFDMAQRAITTGVFDYLVKPVSKGHILEELEKVKIELDKRNEFEKIKSENFKYSMDRERERDSNFISSIIWNSLNQEIWDDVKKHRGISLDTGFLTIIEVITDIDDELKDDFFNDVIKKIGFRYNCIASRSGEKLVIFISESQAPDKYREYLSRYLLDNKTISSRVGYGDLTSYTDFSKSYNMAVSDLKKEISCYGNNNLRNIYKELIYSNKKHGINIYEEYWRWVFSNNSFEVAKGIMISLYTLLLFKLETPRIQIAEEIIPIDSISQWKVWSEKAIDSFYNSLTKDKLSTMPKVLKIALNFVQQNYKEGLQLSSVAEECNVSPSHLSRLFTEHLGTKFIDYLNVYRLEKATELLKEGNMTIKEAAFNVGYTDPNYFSRIYRKYMGVSPSSIE